MICSGDDQENLESTKEYQHRRKMSKFRKLLTFDFSTITFDTKLVSIGKGKVDLDLVAKGLNRENLINL